MFSPMGFIISLLLGFTHNKTQRESYNEPKYSYVNQRHKRKKVVAPFPLKLICSYNYKPILSEWEGS
jgi:hypothetical protein